jgi:hypothetical protein
MSIGLKADPGGASGSIQIAGVDKVIVTNAGDVAATTFTGNLIGNADTATKFAGTTGTAPVYGIRAWVNFDGTKDSTGAASSANTNRLILGSGNVSNVLRLATGRYQINFSIAMPTAYYAINYSTVASTPGTYFTRPYIYPASATTTSAVVWNLTEVSTNSDPTENCVTIVG